MQGHDLELQWLCRSSQSALLLFLKAALCLAHHCSKADSTGATAADYASRGLAALSDPGVFHLAAICDMRCVAPCLSRMQHCNTAASC